MKKRIRIDGILMALGIFAAGLFMYACPHLYPTNRMLEDVLEFLGVILILKGVFLRMAARGHKKEFSRRGEGLVTTGPYALVRNPMYLGTFLIGAGFVLALLPWWFLPLYAGLFYVRFRREIVIEEAHLQKLFGEEYPRYCVKVPRLFPRWSAVYKAKIKKVFPWAELWNTKEQRAILPLLLGAAVFAVFKEKMVYGTFNPGIAVLIFSAAFGIFALGLWVRYQES